MAAVTNNNLFLLPDYAIPKFFGLFHHHLVQLIKQAVVSGGGGVEELFADATAAVVADASKRKSLHRR